MNLLGAIEEARRIGRPVMYETRKGDRFGTVVGIGSCVIVRDDETGDEFEVDRRDVFQVVPDA